MKRRNFIKAIGASSIIGLAGCADVADGPHEPPEEGDTSSSDYLYDYNPDNFNLQVVTISRNAPDKVGVTARIISEQFSGTVLPMEFTVLDSEGDVVFHQPVIEVSLSGGSSTFVTAWFDATEEEFQMDLYPKVRFRESPPE